MTLTALSDEFPYSELERLNISSSYGKLIRHIFYNDGLMKLLHVSDNRPL